MSWPRFDSQKPLEHDCPDCPARAGEPCQHTDPAVPASMVHIRRTFTPDSNAEIEAYYKAEREGCDAHAAVDAVRAERLTASQKLP